MGSVVGYVLGVVGIVVLCGICVGVVVGCEVFVGVVVWLVGCLVGWYDGVYVVLVV